MRFMVIVKASERSESGQMPSPETLARMGAFNEELVKAGILLAGEGLQPSSKGARISFGGSKPVVTDGPFAETKELVGGFWILQGSPRKRSSRGSHARRFKTASRWRFARSSRWKISGRPQSRKRPVCASRSRSGDSGMKFLTIYSYACELADPSGPSEAEMISMGKLIEEMQAAGVLLDFGGAGSTGAEIQVRKSGSTYTVTNGPFTESKEIVGGYAVLSVASRDEAASWTKRFLEAAGDGISELHQLMDAP